MRPPDRGPERRPEHPQDLEPFFRTPQFSGDFIYTIQCEMCGLCEVFLESTDLRWPEFFDSICNKVAAASSAEYSTVFSNEYPDWQLEHACDNYRATLLLRISELSLEQFGYTREPSYEELSIALCELMQYVKNSDSSEF